MKILQTLASIENIFLQRGIDPARAKAIAYGRDINLIGKKVGFVYHLVVSKFAERIEQIIKINKIPSKTTRLV